MHKSAYETGQLFFETYWRPGFQNILDVGSKNVNGSLRDVKPTEAAYIGVDMSPGLGVDLVLKDPHRLPFDNASFDIIVSTSCLEHDPFFWLSVMEMLRVLKPGGYLYINAPSNGVYHAYPLDHWRFSPDAGKALEAWSERAGHSALLLESFIGKKMNDVWADNVMIFALALPEPELPKSWLHKRVAGSRNIRVYGNQELLQQSTMPEDLIELETARQELRQLREESKKEAQIPARDIRSNMPLEFLESIQAGTMRYTYRGISCLKNPIDLALYLKLIYSLQPRTIIELGSNQGGSALWLADMLTIYGVPGHVVSIDIDQKNTFSDSRITFLRGDVLNLSKVLDEKLLRGFSRPFLVIEDSAHFYETTLAALRFFDDYLHVGDYIVVEDGIVNDLAPLGYEMYENGPNRAVMEFLSDNPKKYAIDSEYCDFFGHNCTYNTNGYLKRVA